MKISKTVSTALVAVGYVAENYKDGWVRVATVAKEYNISLKHARKTFLRLAKANILISQKGIGGGFILARDPKEITMLQIIEAVKGPTVMYLNMAEQTQNEKFALKMEEICNKATEKEMQVYDRARLSDMVK